jgi:hypothetical protein
VRQMSASVSVLGEKRWGCEKGIGEGGREGTHERGKTRQYHRLHLTHHFFARVLDKRDPARYCVEGSEGDVCYSCGCYSWC